MYHNFVCFGILIKKRFNSADASLLVVVVEGTLEIMILTNTGIYVFVYYFLNFWAFEFEMRF